MTDVLVEKRDRFGRPHKGYLVWKPTLTANTTTVLPAPVTKKLVDGQATFTLLPNGADWVWVVTEQLLGVQHVVRHLHVPDAIQIAYDDLTEVEGGTVEPDGPEPEPAWFEVARQVITEGWVEGDNLKLRKRNGEVIDAGDVRGAQGLQGDQGIQGLTGSPGDVGPVGPPPNLTVLGTTTGESNPTPYELRGFGSPQGAVTASPGTYYTDTAGTNGAWRWLKKSGTGNTGWAVVMGDTGWRKLALGDGIVGSAVTAGYPLIRRINDVTHVVTGSRMAWHTGSSGGTFMTPPVGFRPTGWTAPMLTMKIWDANSSAFEYQSWSGNFVHQGSPPTAGRNFHAFGTYTTADVWPVTLPGTPA